MEDMNNNKITKFQLAYAECALWSSGDEFDKYLVIDIPPELAQSMKKDCNKFIKENKALLDAAKKLGQTYEMSGHDFWLTRNGHGAGFWDRGLGEVGDKLTAACRGFGEYNLYIGDDGMIYGG